MPCCSRKSNLPRWAHGWRADAGHGPHFCSSIRPTSTWGTMSMICQSLGIRSSRSHVDGTVGSPASTRLKRPGLLATPLTPRAIRQTESAIAAPTLYCLVTNSETLSQEHRSDTLQQETAQRQRVNQVQPILQWLDSSEQEIVIGRFSLLPGRKPRTLEETGVKMGASKTHIRQIQTRAMQRPHSRRVA